MKKLNLFLDEEFIFPINLGLIRVVKKLPAHELFYHMGIQNNLFFSRKNDLKIKKKYYEYSHIIFETFHEETQNKLVFLENKSIFSQQYREIDQLFVEEDLVNYLLKNVKDADYIIKTSENIIDFSLILQRKNILFHIQTVTLSKDDELYQILQYYE